MQDPASAPSARPHPTALPLLLALALELGLVVSWSAGFIGMRFGGDHAPMVLVLLWRSLVSGVLLLPLALARGSAMSLRELAEQVGFGVFAMASYLACYSLAIGLGAPTGIVALITDLLPLMIALLSWPMLRQRLSALQWLGTLLGVAGVLLASNVSMRAGSAPLWAYALPVAGTAVFALATLLLRKAHSRRLPVVQQLCIQCLSAAAAYAPFAWAHGGVAPPLQAQFIGAILWLAFVATFGSWGLYYLALRRFSPARVTAVLYASPPLTLVWAWLMFDEPMSASIVLGLLVSLAGFGLFAWAERTPGTGGAGH